jgi:L-asparagine transporter-like permease
VEVVNIWWEEGFAPHHSDGFVDAMRVALAAYLRFAGAEHVEWPAHLAREKQLFNPG